MSELTDEEKQRIKAEWGTIQYDPSRNLIEKNRKYEKIDEITMKSVMVMGYFCIACFYLICIGVLAHIIKNLLFDQHELSVVLYMVFSIVMILFCMWMMAIQILAVINLIISDKE